MVLHENEFPLMKQHKESAKNENIFINKTLKKLRVCLVTVFPLIFFFQKQFSIFETKKLVWQTKMDRKQKLFSKLNL